ncbi:IS200/IS605 family transposase [Dyadobacter pollutisoli]|uniref:IS200/IS605 family transposase n=1 Tax=Dyadobacter pollutisoli TaxID=2910158 RepID=A0A9E8SQB0_9BACT|nr:IS200/IS605 family transposase [Dyadobacter pollutisoli]WAC12827.1 IS200/IS605 family transposase [Dyadobacter pollutisoli]
MNDIYSRCYIHFVFAVKFKNATISPEWRESLHKYITGITQNNGHKLMAINSMPDHVHMLVGYNVTQAVAELMRLVKGDSSEFINKNKFTPVKFHWQSGYGAFSISMSDIDRHVKYILNQDQHHQNIQFRGEFMKMLKERDIDFDEKYIFEELV